MGKLINRPLRDASRVRTRAKIVAAAKEAFDTLGWEGANVRLIAKAAGVSTGAIFAIWHDGKRSLWSEVMKTAPPVDGCLWRSARGMLTVLQALQTADDADKAMGYPCMAAPRRQAIDAIVASATSSLPFEPF